MRREFEQAIDLFPQEPDINSTQRLQLAESVELSNGEINPLYIEAAFQMIIQLQKNIYEFRPRRRPTRLERVWQVFQGRQDGVILLDEIAKQFPQSKHSNGDARSAITTINRLFEQYGIDLEIKHVSAFRIERRSIPDPIDEN